MANRLISVDSVDMQLPSEVRAASAANLVDEETPEGASLAGAYVAAVAPEAFLNGVDAASVTDWGPYFQAAFDAYPHVHIQGDRDYPINSSVFLDGTSLPTLTTRRHYRLTGDGRARIIIGTGCLTASGQTFDAGTKWGFFVNTLRTANGATSPGRVDTTDATRATATGLPIAPFFVVEGVIIYGTAAQNCGFAYGNSAATFLRSLSLNSLKYGISWFGYSDGNGVRDVGIIGQPVGGWAILQTGSGDGVVLSGVKGTSSGVWKAFGCRGGRIISPVGGGYEFHGCIGIEFESPHQELDETNPYPFAVSVNNSHVTIDEGFYYLGKGTQGPVLLIADDTADPYAHSEVTLRSCVFALFFRPTDNDPVRIAPIKITSINEGSRIRSENSTVMVGAQGGGIHWRGGGLSIDASAVAAVASALSTGSQQYRLSQRDWELAYTANGWELVTE